MIANIFREMISSCFKTDEANPDNSISLVSDNDIQNNTIGLYKENPTLEVNSPTLEVNSPTLEVNSPASSASSELNVANDNPKSSSKNSSDQNKDSSGEEESKNDFIVLDKNNIDQSDVLTNNGANNEYTESQVIHNLLSLAISKKNEFPFSGRHFVRIISIYDADTIKVVFMCGPKPVTISILVLGIDTAEIKCKVPEIKLFAESARDFAREIIPINSIFLAEFYKWDKYGGRVIGDLIFCNQSNKDDEIKLSQIMIQTKFAVKYGGDAKITDAEWLEYVKSKPIDFDSCGNYKKNYGPYFKK